MKDSLNCRTDETSSPSVKEHYRAAAWQLLQRDSHEESVCKAYRYLARAEDLENLA
ncbi:MAG: hypothetical protein WC796_05385 [Candidatus Pacearchaeota archaeon]|jgi:hypothetical protein